MTPQLLRAYVLIFMRDIVTPVAGIYLTIWLAQNGQLEYEYLPLLAGMMCVPLVARASNGEGGSA